MKYVICQIIGASLLGLVLSNCATVRRDMTPTEKFIIQCQVDMVIALVPVMEKATSKYNNEDVIADSKVNTFLMVQRYCRQQGQKFRQELDGDRKPNMVAIGCQEMTYGEARECRKKLSQWKEDLASLNASLCICPKGCDCPSINNRRE